MNTFLRTTTSDSCKKAVINDPVLSLRPLFVVNIGALKLGSCLCIQEIWLPFAAAAQEISVSKNQPKPGRGRMQKRNTQATKDCYSPARLLWAYAAYVPVSQRIKNNKFRLPCLRRLPEHTASVPKLVYRFGPPTHDGTFSPHSSSKPWKDGAKMYRTQYTHRRVFTPILDKKAQLI